MVIKGGSKGHAARLAAHLTRTDHNDRVELLELDETAATPTVDALLREYQTIAETTTRSRKGLYEASINPTENDDPLTHEQWIEAADILGKELGLDGQPRVIVLHEKEGREHIHVVWQRTEIAERPDLENTRNRVIDDGWNYRAHELAARQIEQKFDLEITPGVHSREPNTPRPDRATKFWENQQANRTALSADDRKALIKNLFEHSDGARAFTAALEEQGFHLARGDKNIFMVVDPSGQAYNLSRELKGYRKKEVEAKLNPLTPANFRPVSEVQEELARPAEALNRADAIHKKHDQAKKQLQKDHAATLRRLQAKHKLADERRARLQKTKRPRGFSKLIQDATGITWVKDKLFERKTREILARQRAEILDLKQAHKNSLREIEAARTADLANLNQDLLPDKRPIRARFELKPKDQPLGRVQASLTAIAQYDAANQELADVNHTLRSLRSTVGKIRARQDYFEALDATVRSDFDKLYKNGADARETFQDHVEEHGIRQSIKDLKKDPGQFGALNRTRRPIDRLADIETAAADARRAHYLRTKIEHEAFGLKMYETSINSLQKRKREIETNPTDERLSMLLDLQEQAEDLPRASTGALTADQQHLVREARRLMRRRELRRRASEFRREQRRQLRELEKRQRQGPEDLEPEFR